MHQGNADAIALDVDPVVQDLGVKAGSGNRGSGPLDLIVRPDEDADFPRCRSGIHCGAQPGADGG